MNIISYAWFLYTYKVISIFFVYLFFQVRKKKQEKKISWNQVVESVHNKNTKAKEEFYLMLSCQIIRQKTFKNAG